MTEDQTIGRAEILALTSDIVSSHVANNAVGPADVPDLIQSVYSKLNEIASGEDANMIELTTSSSVSRTARSSRCSSGI